MRFKSDSQRRAVFWRMNRFSDKSRDIVHLYHGTTDKLLAEKMHPEEMRSKNGLIYMTTNPSFAGVYAKEAAKTGTGWDDQVGISEIEKRDKYPIVGGVPVIVEVEIPEGEMSGWNMLTVRDSLNKRQSNSEYQGKDISPFSPLIYDEIPFEKVPIKYIKDIHYLGKNNTVFANESSEAADDEFVEKVLKEYGETYNMFESGFVLPSGKMVDLSRGQGFREKKHDSIVDIDSNYGNLYDKLRDVMKEHKLMRVDVSRNSPSDGRGRCSFVEIHHKPTEKQKEFIKNTSREVQRLGDESSDDNASLLIEYYRDGKRRLYASTSPKIYEIEKFLDGEVKSDEI